METKTFTSTSSSNEDIEKLKLRFIESLRSSGNVSVAVKAVGISRSAIYEYRKQDLDFARQWRDAHAEFFLYNENAEKCKKPNFTVDRRRAIIKAKFLDALRNVASVSVAIGVAGVSRTSIYKYRNEDRQFAIDWDNALLVSLDMVNDEGMRLGVFGVKRKIFKNRKFVRTEKKQSERVLVEMLRFSFRKRFEIAEKNQANNQVQKTGIVDRLTKYFDRIAESKGNYS